MDYPWLKSAAPWTLFAKPSPRNWPRSSGNMDRPPVPFCVPKAKAPVSDRIPYRPTTLTVTKDPVHRPGSGPIKVASGPRWQSHAGWLRVNARASLPPFWPKLPRVERDHLRIALAKRSASGRRHATATQFVFKCHCSPPALVADGGHDPSQPPQHHDDLAHDAPNHANLTHDRHHGVLLVETDENPEEFSAPSKSLKEIM